jgi:hypothetical protein
MRLLCSAVQDFLLEYRFSFTEDAALGHEKSEIILRSPRKRRKFETSFEDSGFMEAEAFTTLSFPFQPSFEAERGADTGLITLTVSFIPHDPDCLLT